jgi:hypothetical protein
MEDAPYRPVAYGLEKVLHVRVISNAAKQVQFFFAWNIARSLLSSQCRLPYLLPGNDWIWLYLDDGKIVSSPESW